MEKYDAAFSATENELIYEARLIPPDMERIEALLRQGADLNKIGAERNVFLTILEYYGEYVDENGEVRESGQYLPDLLELFFRYGLDVRVKNEDEMSALWCFVWPTAMDDHMLEAAELLLKHSAKANSRYQNETPLDYIEESARCAGTERVDGVGAFPRKIPQAAYSLWRCATVCGVCGLGCTRAAGTCKASALGRQKPPRQAEPELPLYIQRS